MKMDLVKTRQVRVSDIRPSPENDLLYRPVDQDAPDFRALVDSISLQGVLEPLVISEDGFIISGHRRFAAATMAGLSTLPCRVEAVRRDDAGFVALLREYNRQRIKTFSEMAREEIVSMSPDESYQALLSERARAAEIQAHPLEIEGKKRRHTISRIKRPLLEAVQEALESLRKFWPISERRIFYQLLDKRPVRNANKRNPFVNDRASYADLSDICTRGRLAGLIPMEAISDETRPVTMWKVNDNAQDFIRNELNDFMMGFWRNLLQSQPNHIEIFGEKNTLGPIIRPVAMKYCLPVTLGRGFCSLPPRVEMVERFRKSGKEKLVVIVLSDHDPDGEVICSSFAQSIRDDFGINSVQAFRAALTREQVNRHGLKYGQPVKQHSRNRARFIRQYGPTCFELEALPPETLQDELEQVILSVLDLDAFNQEVEAEKSDAQRLESFRGMARKVLLEMSTEVDL